MTELLVGRPVLISIDHQMAGYNESYAVPQMGGYAERVRRAVALVEAARESGIPVIFVQERHARTLADFGRELDGSEDVHCVEDDPDTALVPELTPLPDEYFVPKRRYSAFFGTDLEILLKGLRPRRSCCAARTSTSSSCSGERPRTTRRSSQRPRPGAAAWS